MSAVDVKYMLGATKYDIVDFIYNHLHKYGWKTTYNYLIYKPKEFYQKPLTIPEGSILEFKKYINYCSLLSRNFTKQDEAERYKGRNGIGIYFSVVLYWLLVSFGVVNEKKLKFCQGYYSYEMRQNNLDKPRYRAGMHAWLCYDGAVLDVTIWQQKEYFDFGDNWHAVPIILGDIPEKLDLFGFEEDKRLPKEYARQFAKDSGKTFYEWIDFHKKQVDLLDKALTMEKRNP